MTICSKVPLILSFCSSSLIKDIVNLVMEISMAKRSRAGRIYKYNCTITEEEYKVTSKSQNPEELISVRAYYEMNPDEDDRPEAVIKSLGDIPEASSEEEEEEEEETQE
jgi:hypothetical protein